ncbi:hypothetical protein N656DRAFT_796857 [Canariomyces notabilis]|uniref:Uncharacterized protein n=1 Tax=Canariomyces notabilis TaxID=2074819 RepID=A0AAN6TH62_9PEZI|nr:hypothetical protein N656DRAFT_796857 [Canariomyces arenarius]
MSYSDDFFDEELEFSILNAFNQGQENADQASVDGTQSNQNQEGSQEVVENQATPDLAFQGNPYGYNQPQQQLVQQQVEQPVQQHSYPPPPAPYVPQQYGMQPQFNIPQGQPSVAAEMAYPPHHLSAPTMAQAYPPVLAPQAGFPPQLPIPNQVLHGGVKLTHNRKRKFEPGNDPGRIYQKPSGLGPWGPIVPAKQPYHTFEYCKSTAELKPMRMFSKEELILFFHGVGHPNPNRRLTLWIQNTPAQSNDRYANGPSSGKCRYVDCRAGQNTILKGFFRVAFDEFSDHTGVTLDPFHNAGYMHLHCFEELFDLGYLIHYGAAAYGFSIRPDTRQFPFETRNTAGITRDHQEMANAYHEWVAQQKARVDLIRAQNEYYTGFDPHWVPPHNQRLGYALTIAHMSLEVKGRARKREERGGVHIGQHLGNLDVHNKLKRREARRKRREARNQSDTSESSSSSGSQQPSNSPQPGNGFGFGNNNSPAYVRLGTPVLPDNNIYGAPPPQQPVHWSNSRQSSQEDEEADDGSRGRKRRRIEGAQTQTQPAWTGQAQPQHGWPPASEFSPRTTRQRSRETGESILGMITSQPHLTRSTAQQVQELLQSEPQHVQAEVQTQIQQAAPQYAPLVMPPPDNGGVDRMWVEPQDNLEARLGRLPRRQRREVDEFVRRRERRGGKIKYQSL